MDSMMSGWECRETDRGRFQEVRYAAYRTAVKLRYLQEQFGLNLLTLQCVRSVFSDHGYTPGFAGSIDSRSLHLILLDLLHTPTFRHFDSFRQDEAADLLHNYLSNLFDVSRSGSVSALSVKLALSALCDGKLSDKYQYFCDEVLSGHTTVSREQLVLFVDSLMQCSSHRIEQCKMPVPIWWLEVDNMNRYPVVRPSLHGSIHGGGVDIPDLIDEGMAFGTDITAVVDSCLRMDGSSNCAVYGSSFYAWLQQERQIFVWLPTLHNIIAAETVRHGYKCKLCKAFPIVGLRYQCLQCFNFNMCQACFFAGRTGKGHQIKHPIREHRFPVSVIEAAKTLLKVIRNKVSRTKSSSKTALVPVDDTSAAGIPEKRATTRRRLPPPPPLLSQLSTEGRAASEDSGHGSEQGGDDLSQSRPIAPPSSSLRSLYDNTNSPSRHLTEKPAETPRILPNDRCSLIRLVHKLRQENRSLRQELLVKQSDDRGQSIWRTKATAELSALCSAREENCDGFDCVEGGNDLTASSRDEVGDRPPDDVSAEDILLALPYQRHVGRSPGPVSAHRSEDSGLPDVALRSSPEKPKAVLGTDDAPGITFLPEITDKNASTFDSANNGRCSMSKLVSFQAQMSTDSSPHLATSLNNEVIHQSNDRVLLPGATALQNSHTLRIPAVDQGVGDVGIQTGSVPDHLWRICGDKFQSIYRAQGFSKQVQSCDISDPMSANACYSGQGFIGDCNYSCRGVNCYADDNSEGVHQPDSDRNLLDCGGHDLLLSSPERHEISKTVEWIDKAFPADLSYSALSLCHDELTA